MNLTFGFIAFFIAVIIPGILFRRFFYYGEFSKQFDSKDPVLHSIFYSIVPGVCIQVICFVLGDKVFSFGIENVEIFNIFKDFVYSGQKSINEDTKDFLNKDLSTFIYYSISIFFISILTGQLSSRFIRWLGWDKRFKIFKFKNQWFYIFSGELLRFEKFEVGRMLTTNDDIEHDQKISITYADILVDNTDGMRELYTGYVVDYDLSSEDISKLERIYLLDTHRYKHKESNVYKREAKWNVEAQHSVADQVDYKSRIRKRIPGNVFVVGGKDILNINLTYVPSEKKKELRENKVQKRYIRFKRAYLIIVIISLLLHFTYELIGLGDTWFGHHLENSNWFARFIVFIGFIQLLSIGAPSLSLRDKKYRYDWREILFRLIWLSVIYLFLCGMQTWGWLSSEFPLWNIFE